MHYYGQKQPISSTDMNNPLIIVHDIRLFALVKKRRYINYFNNYYNKRRQPYNSLPLGIDAHPL